MSVIELNIDKEANIKYLQNVFDKNTPHKGDTIRLLTSENDAFVYQSLIIIGALILTSYHIEKTKARRHEFAEKTLGELKLFSAQFNSLKELEEEFEKEFGLSVEVRHQNQYTDPIDKFFGILKGHDIDLNQIREEAWGRKK